MGRYLLISFPKYDSDSPFGEGGYLHANVATFRCSAAKPLEQVSDQSLGVSVKASDKRFDDGLLKGGQKGYPSFDLSKRDPFFLLDGSVLPDADEVVEDEDADVIPEGFPEG